MNECEMKTVEHIESINPIKLFEFLKLDVEVDRPLTSTPPPSKFHLKLLSFQSQI